MIYLHLYIYHQVSIIFSKHLDPFLVVRHQIPGEEVLYHKLKLLQTLKHWVENPWYL